MYNGWGRRRAALSANRQKSSEIQLQFRFSPTPGMRQSCQRTRPHHHRPALSEEMLSAQRRATRPLHTTLHMHPHTHSSGVLHNTRFWMPLQPGRLRVCLAPIFESRTAANWEACQNRKNLRAGRTKARVKTALLSPEMISNNADLRGGGGGDPPPPHLIGNMGGPPPPPGPPASKDFLCGHPQRGGGGGPQPPPMAA